MRIAQKSPMTVGSRLVPSHIHPDKVRQAYNTVTIFKLAVSANRLPCGDENRPLAADDKN